MSAFLHPFCLPDISITPMCWPNEVRMNECNEGIERNGMFILNPNYGELDNQMWKSVEKQTSRP